MLRHICSHQQQNGLWKGEPILQTNTATGGNAFVTTALIVEALTHYRTPTSSVSRSSFQEKHRVIEQAAVQFFSAYTEPLRSTALTAVTKMCEAEEKFEITLMSEFFVQALKKPIPLTNSQHQTLGLANICTWIAYSIYDDFLDEEGIPAQLPVANVALRASLANYQSTLPDNRSIQHHITATFDAMDEANAWEIHHCRFLINTDSIRIAKLPQYRTQARLAARSFAHALSPLIVLATDSSINRPTVKRIESAFRHYLIARQLNDDLCDWQQDIQVGQINFVVAAILRDMHVKPGIYSLRELVPLMQRQFRRTSMSKIARIIRGHVKQSRSSFRKSHLMRSDNEIYKLLTSVESSVNTALDTHAKGHALTMVPANLLSKYTC